MQTIINSNELGKNQHPVKIFFGDNEIAKDIRIVDFMKKSVTGEWIITLHSPQFLSDRVKVYIRNEKLIFSIHELVDTRKHTWKPVTDWEQYMGHTYTRIHNVSILLPGDNFYIIRQFLIPEKLFLNVILGMLPGN